MAEEYRTGMEASERAAAEQAASEKAAQERVPLPPASTCCGDGAERGSAGPGRGCRPTQSSTPPSG